MSVGEFMEYMGNHTLAEMSYRVAIAEDMEWTLDELGTRMSVAELANQIVLREVEAEYASQQANNASRSKGG